MKDDASSKLAKYIRKLRLGAGMSLNEVANILDVNRSLLYRIEHGSTAGLTSASFLKKLADFHNITVFDLLYECNYFEDNNLLNELNAIKDRIEAVAFAKKQMGAE